MRKTLVSMMFCGCFLVLTAATWGQVRKPGLWELTTNTTWQQSPFPVAMPGGLHTTQVCLTQEQIDKYGAILPESNNRSCQVINVVKTATSMTADMVCTGKTMTGKGNMESTMTDDNHAKGSVHFVGAVQMGSTSKPMEWTATSTSVYKGADCGSVKPLPMPGK